MEKINYICILKVVMSGFKRFLKPFEVNLSEISYISGHNEQGKTSIADAITFAFYGIPLWGERSADRLMNKEAKVTQVTVKFVDGNGELHTLVRRRTGDNTTVTLDTFQIRQADLYSIFAEKDIFLSIFNPLYFIEKIAEDGRTFLQRLLPPVSQEDVLAQLSENFVALLEKESLLDPAYYIKTKRESVRELEENTTYFEGQVDLLKMQRLENQNKHEEYGEQISNLQQKIRELEDAQFKDMDKESLLQQKEKIIELISSERRKNLLEKKSSLAAMQYQSKLTGELAKLNEEIKVLAMQREKLVSLVKGIRPGIKCPSCLRKITEQNQLHVLAELKSQLNEVNERGKGLVDSRTELIELDKKCEVQFLKFRDDDLRKVDTELLEFEGADLQQLSFLEDTLRLGNLSEEQMSELCSLRADLKQLETELQLMNDNAAAEEIKRLETNIQTNRQNILSAHNMAHAAEEFAAKQAEISLQRLKMNKAAIKLYDVVKTTGEIKNIFRFTYDGLDYRCLSRSQKTKAGVEVSNLLRELTGCNYPTFIDDAEGITTAMQRPKGQTIFAFAKPGDLCVTCKNQTSQEAA